MAAAKFFSVFYKPTGTRVTVPVAIVEAAPKIKEPGVWVCGNYVPRHTIEEAHHVLFKMGNSDKVIITPSLFQPELPTPYGKLEEEEACRIYDLYGGNYNRVRSITKSDNINQQSPTKPVDAFFHPDGFMLNLNLAKLFSWI